MDIETRVRRLEERSQSQEKKKQSVKGWSLDEWGLCLDGQKVMGYCAVVPRALLLHDKLFIIMEVAQEKGLDWLKDPLAIQLNDEFVGVLLEGYRTMAEEGNRRHIRDLPTLQHLMNKEVWADARAKDDLQYEDWWRGGGYDRFKEEQRRRILID
jgi:hypothetical protein